MDYGLHSLYGCVIYFICKGTRVEMVSQMNFNISQFWWVCKVWKCLQLHTHEPRQIISFLPSFYTVASYQLNCGTGPRFTVIYRALKRRRLVNLFVTKIHFLQSILCTWMPTRTHTHTHKKQYAFAYKKRSSFCLEFAHFIVNFYIPWLICESNCAIWFRGNSKWN